METNPGTCNKYDFWPKVLMILICMYSPFQIDNLESDTNQLSSILGATRSNLDKLNSTLVNNTLEVGLEIIKKMSKFTYGFPIANYLSVL